MKNKEYNNIIKALSKLDTDEKRSLVTTIMDMMSTVCGKPVSFECNNMVQEYTFKNERPDCPHCNARANLGFILKRGFKGETQRYFCKSCGRTFVATTKTTFEKTRKSSETWKKFIELTIEGYSIAKCAEECELAITTAFTWRHKVLNAFRVHQSSVQMTGDIEMDEMLIPINYKGNHMKGQFSLERRRLPGEPNNLPRKSHRRGSDSRSTDVRDKACVFCMVENGNKSYFASVPGVGYMQENMLESTLPKHVNKDSAVIIVDKYKTTLRFLNDNNYSYVSLLSNTSDNPNKHKPEILDGYHLQHVNSFHSHLRAFLAKYRGVSTKYLENYVSLFVWLKSIKANKQSRHLKRVTISRASTPDCYISRKQIEAMPAVPMCA